MIYLKYFNFLLLIFLLPLNSFSLYIILDSNIVKEGNLIKIKIKNERILQAGEVEFLNKNFQIYFDKYEPMERQYVYSCLIPVPLNISEKKEINIKILVNKQIIEKKEKIIIKKIKLRKSIIKTNKIDQNFFNDIKKDKNILSNLQNQIISAKFKFPFIMPVEGEITTDFGSERIYNDGVTRWRHKGIDISAKKGTPVKATNNGIVAGTYSSKIYGNFVIINHGVGIYSLYMHLQKVYVKNNQQVFKNDIIGTVGDTGFATGPHLHWQINIHKIPINPKELLINW